MQNLSYQDQAESERFDSASHSVAPQCDYSMSEVTSLCNPGVTSIIPTHTATSPPTHTSLSIKQAQVLDVLVRNLNRRTSYNSVGAAVGISKPAAISAIKQLVNKKYISDLITVRDGVFQGFTYWTDSLKCQQFMKEGGASNERFHVITNTLTPLPHTVCSPSDPYHAFSSSSSLEQKLTTVDLTDPELQWWADQGLTRKQIISWLDQFRMKTEELAQSLRFARYDAVLNEIKPNGKPIENPQNWFYTILRRAGAYQRPKNYKSIYEIRANELEEQQRHDEAAKAKIWKAEIDSKFSEIMNHRESPLFQELFGCVGEFEKDNPFAFEIKMKELLKERYPIGSL